MYQTMLLLLLLLSLLKVSIFFLQGRFDVLWTYFPFIYLNKKCYTRVSVNYIQLSAVKLLLNYNFPTIVPI